ncbi:MAG: YbdD/YjiX family protein [Pseudomonadota bacterium]
MNKRIGAALLHCWRALRELSGDDAYERYLAHHAACHADDVPLSRKAYFQRQQQQKWEGIKRCC